MKRQIVIFGFDGVCALDLFGPADAFSAARSPTGEPTYHVTVAGLTKRTFRTEAGFRVMPDHTLSAIDQIDTLIVPGGEGLRHARLTQRFGRWLQVAEPRIRRIVTVCTGIYGVAPTGLLDGRGATSHWRFADDLTRSFPAISFDPDAIFLRDGKFYTSAGITAGIDLALALVEEDLGSTAALSVARELVVYLKRPGGQRQFSEPLSFQTTSPGRMGDLAAWIDAHLADDLRVDALARHVCLSPRQFTRRFAEVFRSTPASYVDTVRLEAARDRLLSTKASVEVIAGSAGFLSTDAFTRAFRRRFGVAPSQFRSRFHGGQ